VIRQPLAKANTSLAATEAVAGEVSNGPSFVNTVASPLRLMATPPVLRHAPPRLGEHTDEVLAELGLDAAKVAALRALGVV
jgi:formyl-CoA transferase